MDIQHSLQQAVFAQQAGRLDEAAQHYRAVLTIDPNQQDALHRLGLVEVQLGNEQQGISYLQAALRLRPDWPEVHNNLGIALQAQGKLDEAVASFRRAVRLNPDYAVGCYNLAMALQRDGLLNEAVASYKRSLELHPDDAEVHNNLGIAFEAQGDLSAAIMSYSRAVELEPDYAAAFYNLGNVLKRQGELDSAIASYHRALGIKPDDAHAHNNLGIALYAQGKLDEAVASYCQALKLKPDDAEVHNNLGVALQAQARLGEAVTAYHRALELTPHDAAVHNNLGSALQAQGNVDEARASYDRALELKPDDAEAHNNRALLELLKGNFAAGWPEHEWRWKTRQFTERVFDQPRWDGSPLASRTILLHADHGLGDTMQFIRYAALLKKQNPAATVVVGCQRQLVNLLARCPGIDHLVGSPAALPEFDIHLPLLSLPNVFKTSLDTIPADIPYAFADADLVTRWRGRLHQIRGLRIGINWEGRSDPGEHLKRNIPLGCFVELAQHVPGITLISLQKRTVPSDPPGIQVDEPIVDIGPELDAAGGAFTDTAAVMMNLDLVISSDTSIPHLAGALGVPVWLAVPSAPEWRWLLDRDDSPWYPTMRIFRQRKPGDWPELFERISAALRTLVLQS